MIGIPLWTEIQVQFSLQSAEPSYSRLISYLRRRHAVKDMRCSYFEKLSPLRADEIAEAGAKIRAEP